jgi:hypothetical protein
MTFPPIDVDGTVRKLRLRERALEQASRNMPGADSQGFDTVEQDVVNEIDTEANTRYQEYLFNQKTYGDRQGDLGIPALKVKIGSVTDAAIADFGKAVQGGKDELFARANSVIDHINELTEFRRENALRRPAFNLGGRNKKIGLLLILLSFEAVLNGTFLAQGSVYGIAGGILKATVIAGVNIAIAWLVGFYVARGLAHKNWGLKILCGLIIVGYLGLAFGFNLWVAHYRTALAIDPFEAATLSLRSWKGDPFGIEDGESWLLFLMGFVFAIFSVIDSWAMDDPYPGYGNRHRTYQRAINAYTRKKTTLLNELEDIQKDAVDELEKIGKDVQSRQNEHGLIALRSQSLRSSIEQHFAHLESAANTLLRFYRDENRKARTSDAPVRFDESWKLSRPETLANIVVTSDQAKLEQLVKEALEQIPVRREALHQAYRENYREYDRIDDMVKAKVQS